MKEYRVWVTLTGGYYEYVEANDPIEAEEKANLEWDITSVDEWDVTVEQAEEVN